VVSLSGVLTRSQCPCRGTGSVYGRVSASGFDRVSRLGTGISTVWR
jgi:hypothetical protein